MARFSHFYVKCSEFGHRCNCISQYGNIWWVFVTIGDLAKSGWPIDKLGP